ncbi:MAG: hypothetical protein JSS51_04055 [Planctomycetes bacterium]|nr:hypothetical protein [Planctomycetota bacterium]
MKVYDWLDAPGRPTPVTQPIPGLLPCRVSGQAFYAIKPNTGGARDLTKLDAAEAAKWASEAPEGAPIILDIETRRDPEYREIRTDVRRFSGHEVEEDAKFIDTALRFVKEAAGGPVGLYGEFPNGFDIQNRVLLADYPALHRAMLSAEYFLTFLNNGKSVGMLNPSLYASTIDPSLWALVANTVIACAQAIQKAFARPFSIVPFLSPVFHPSVPDVGGTLVPLTYWRSMLSTCRSIGADGVVLWCGGNAKAHWRDFGPYIAAAQRVAGYTPPQADTMKAGSGSAVPGRKQ